MSSLGEQILSELGKAETTDTLARWMSHRLAELLSRGGSDAEATAADVRREAADLVLRLWARRRDWPVGWPPEGAARVLAALEGRAAVEFRSSSISSLDNVVGVLQQLRALSNEEDLLTLQFVMAQPGFDAGERWPGQGLNHLGDDERETLAAIARLAGRARDGTLVGRWAAEDADGTEPSDGLGANHADWSSFVAIDEQRVLLRERLKELLEGEKSLH